MNERLRALLMLVLVFVCTAHAIASEPGVELWYDVTLNGASMGYAHEWVETSEDADVVTSVSTRMHIQRGDHLIRLEVSEQWTETPDGRPLEYGMTTRMSDRETKVDLVIEGESARLRHAVGSDATLQDVPIPAGLLFPAAAKRRMVEHGFTPGTGYSYVGFDAESEAVATYTVTVVGCETLELMGESVELTEYTIDCSARPGLPAHEWRDAGGVLWKYELPATGIALARTTQEEAQAEKEIFDLLMATAVTSNVTLRAPFRVDEALLEVWLDDGSVIDELIVEDARQTIEGHTDRGVLLRVARVTPDPGEVVQLPIESAPMQEYMDGNPLMQTWHPRILGVASRQVWETDRNVWTVSSNIERWVFDEIDKKGFGTGFASATEVLNTREGDCSEHAVLMTAMVRSLSIPAKLVSGVTHYRGDFLYHMWVEVWTGDDWYALDPTIGDGGVDAMHIKFGESSAKNGNVSDLAYGILRVFGRLNIRVIEYSQGGQVVRP